MNFVFECPHCKDFFIMNEKELNCRIIRHAVFKNNLEQVSPHLPKSECDRLVDDDLVLGCCKPLKIEQNEKNEYIAVKSDYIWFYNIVV